MKIYLSKNEIIQNIILLLTVALLSSIVIFETYSKGSLILVGIILLILIFSIFQNGFSKKIKIGKYHLFVGVFALYCLLSSTWSIYPEKSIRMGVTIFEILICFSILYNYYSRFDSIEKLLLCISWSSVTVVLYTIYFYGISFILSNLSRGRRLSNGFANINTISGIAALGVVIMFYFIFYDKKYKYFPFIAINIFIIAASGSRKSLLLPIIGCFLIVIIKNFRNKNFLLNIIKGIILGALFCIGVKLILQIPAFDMINTRIEEMISSFTGHGEVDISTLKRKMMVVGGWEQFKETPFLGIGIGNSNIITKKLFREDTYLHNNFVELLACGGIVGFLIYYNIYLYIYYNFFKNWKYKTDASIVCVILCFCLFVLDYGQVSYYSKDTYFYFMLFFICISALKRKKRFLRKKKIENSF